MIVRAHPDLPGPLIVEPTIYPDQRGAFHVSWNADRYAEAGIRGPFIQDNVVRSRQGTLRGLHFQHPMAQGKLVSVIRGIVFDVVVDARIGSPTFGRSATLRLDDVSCQQFWVPRGFAHGYCVLSESADVIYKVDAPYRPEEERVIAWNDPDLAISWPVDAPTLNNRDSTAPRLRDLKDLPRYGAER